MLINVTTEDIRLGVRCSQTHCPIARALKRNFPDSIIVVGSVWSKIDEERFELNQESIQFVSDFDDLNLVEPFSFDFKINPLPE